MQREPSHRRAIFRSFGHLGLSLIETELPLVSGLSRIQPLSFLAKNSQALPTVDKAVELKEEVGWGW